MSTLVRPPLDAAPELVSAAERIVGRVRAGWRRSVVLQALLAAPALAAALAFLLFAADLAAPLPAPARVLLRWVPAAAALGWIAFSIRRVVRPPAPRRFALLAEERVPALGNRLATALDAPRAEGPVGRAFSAEAARRLAAADVRGVAPTRVKTPALVLAAAVGIGTAFALLFPGAAAEAWGRWTSPRDAYEAQWREVRASTLPAVPTPPMPVFEELRWRVAPPAYAGVAATEG
ncbi:MAG TPA: hypothetical protein VEW03_04885, partial [Longimicrobiaceae bacterium]|nr:hypothetical protein [Longimicrobiaceae bacterium]